FQGMPLTVLRACIAERVPYVDVADDRDFVRRAYALVETHAPPHGMLALIGCSVVPGLTSLLTRFAQATVHRIVQTKICISPGTQHPRGPGSFACLLSAVGKEFSAPADGKQVSVIGWTEPERFLSQHRWAIARFTVWWILRTTLLDRKSTRLNSSHVSISY